MWGHTFAYKKRMNNFPALMKSIGSANAIRDILNISY